MARLTLSEQVNELSSKLATMTAELHTAQGTIATHLSTIERQQSEVHTLHKLVEEIPALREQINKLTKELESSKNGYSYRDKAAEKAEAEIEQAHAVLDSVEGCPTREYEVPGGYGSRSRSLVTRLAGAFLAIARSGGVK